MIDTRMIWVTYFSPNPEKVSIVLPKNIEAAAVRTLLEHCGKEGQPTILRHDSSATSFSPLSQTQLDKIGCETVIYLCQSRESFKSIKRKINASRKFSVEEYSVFPGWGNPRWFVPSNRSLWRGKMSPMIQPSRLVAKTAVTVFRLLKMLGWEHYLFCHRLIVAHNTINLFLNFFEALGPNVRTGIMFTGSFGPLQKFTVELLKDADMPFAYAKFGHNEYTKRAIQNEQAILKKIAELPLTNMRVPELLDCKLPGILSEQTLTMKKLDGGRPPNHLTDIVMKGLVELFITTQEPNKVSINSYITNQVKSIQERDCSCLEKEYREMTDEVIAILKNITSLGNDMAMLPLGLSHGDFTRWNVRADADRIYVIDWEEAAIRPPVHDLLSFLLAEYRAKNSPMKTAQMMLLDFKNGYFNVYLDKINFNKKIKTEYLGIMFFADTFHSCLWHAELHNRFNYPLKAELIAIARTAYICIQGLTPCFNRAL